MNDDVLGRLRSQAALLRNLRTDSAGLAADEALRKTDRVQLQAQDDSSKELLRRLEDQTGTLDGALEHVAAVRRQYTDLLQNDAQVSVELERVLADVRAANDNICSAINQDESGKLYEQKVMGLLQKASLQAFGPPSLGVVAI